MEEGRFTVEAGVELGFRDQRLSANGAVAVQHETEGDGKELN